ncbi:MAG: hypothetical protein HOB73_13015 [Planctomycetaceae bacterium]|jgi:hypothetical protein|nr:hypothetical protein [Planctomycetaceae bacterium]
MAIDVICSGCFKRFQVSDQFAGRSGPCPGCKTVITIPALEDQVVIEEPVHKPGAPGAHTKIGGISRRAGVFQRFEIIVLSSLFGGAAFVAVLSRILQSDPVGVLTPTTGTLFTLGLLLVSLGSSLLGYGVLKNSEVESFNRRAAIIRSAITAAIYCFIASAFIAATLLLDHQDSSRVLILAIVGVACLAIASFAPMVLFEMEMTQGALHVAVMICMFSLFCLLANNFHQWLLAS